MATPINTQLFNDTAVIKALREKQSTADDDLVLEIPVDAQTQATPVKSKRGRKKLYHTEEERIAARKAQQKAYRDKKRRELEELRALKARIESQTA